MESVFVFDTYYLQTVVRKHMKVPILRIRHQKILVWLVNHTGFVIYVHSLNVILKGSSTHTYARFWAWITYFIALSNEELRTKNMNCFKAYKEKMENSHGY